MINTGQSISNLSVHLTEDCNLRCEYCFVTKKPKSITEEIGKQTIDFLLHPIISPDDDSVHIQFFGGEPMLKWEIMKTMIEYGEEQAAKVGKSIRYGITTNATLFNDEKLDFIEKHKAEILFSIDGDKFTQDMHRKTVTGGSSWDLIEPYIERVVRMQPIITARMTYTPKTLPYLADNVEYLLNLGFSGVAPSCAYDSSEPFSEADWDEWDRQYERIIASAIKRIKQGKPSGMNYLDKCIRQIVNNSKLKSPCGAGKKFFGVSVDGGLYPCHRFAQWPEWILGDIWSGVTNEKARQLTGHYNVDMASTKCANCKVGFCGGTCLAANYENNGSIWIPSKDGCRVAQKQWGAAQRLHEAINDIRAESNVLKVFAEKKIEEGGGDTYKDGYNQPQRLDISDVYDEVKKGNQILEALSSVLLDYLDDGGV